MDVTSGASSAFSASLCFATTESLSSSLMTRTYVKHSNNTSRIDYFFDRVRALMNSNADPSGCDFAVDYSSFPAPVICGALPAPSSGLPGEGAGSARINRSIAELTRFINSRRRYCKSHEGREIGIDSYAAINLLRKAKLCSAACCGFAVWVYSSTVRNRL